MNYVWHLVIFINIYIILSISLNLVVGWGGMLSLCHAAFYGIGAYASALLCKEAGWNYFAALPVSILITTILGWLITKPTLRLKGDYFILGTMAFQMIVFSILYNWIDFTRGPYGISGIPRPVAFGYTIKSLPDFAALSGGLMIIVVVFCHLLLSSPYGRLLRAIREDEVAAAALGKDVLNARTQAFAIAAGLAAVAGALYAHYVTYIDPTSFTIHESILIVTMIIVGGLGTIRGAVLGAIILLLVPEALRFLEIPDAVAANLRQMLYASFLILCVFFRPRGLCGEVELQ